MVAGLAFVATAVATVFAQSTAARWSRTRQPHQGAWAVALALFALACAALATGASTGWDAGTFRAFYLLGAIVNVPWLALGTVYLLAGTAAGRAGRVVLLLFTGLATGVMLATPLHGTIAPDKIPVGKEHLDALPRALAGIGSGVGALVVFAGAALSAVRVLRRRGPSRLAIGNGLIAAGTVVLSSGGLAQGVLGHDESFALSLAVGISVIYAGASIATLPAGAGGGAPSSAGTDRAGRSHPGGDAGVGDGAGGVPGEVGEGGTRPVGDVGGADGSRGRTGYVPADGPGQADEGGERPTAAVGGADGNDGETGYVPGADGPGGAAERTRRSTLPVDERGSSATSSTRVGSL